jgi:Permeases of the drug/metabolite transporter (DMT) superfamily
MGVIMQKNIRAYLDLALAMFISGSAVVVSKMMVTSLPVFLATELGILVGMVLLIPFTFFIKKCREKLDLRTYLIIFAQAFCGVFLYRIFTFIGLKSTTAATSGLITSASPVIVLLLAYFLLKEKITVRQIIAIVCTVIGLLLLNLLSFMADQGHGSPMGNSLIIAAVICEGLFSVLSKVKCKPVSALFRTTIIVINAFLLLLPFSLWDAFHFDFHKTGIGTIACVAYFGVFVTFLSYVLWFRGIEKVKAANAAVFTSVVPISSILLSVILLNECLLPFHLLSLIFIIAGILISIK